MFTEAGTLIHMKPNKVFFKKNGFVKKKEKKKKRNVFGETIHLGTLTDFQGLFCIGVPFWRNAVTIFKRDKLLFRDATFPTFFIFNFYLMIFYFILVIYI